VFGNKLLRTIFGPTKEDVKEERREMHNEKIIHSYPSVNIISVLKSMRMRRS
jgi:hypothetical protein